MPSLRPRSRPLQGLLLSRPARLCRHGSTFDRRVHKTTNEQYLKHARRTTAPDPSKVTLFKASDILLDLVDENTPGVRSFNSARDDPVLSEAWKSDGIHKERWRRMARDELKKLALGEQDAADEQGVGDGARTAPPSNVGGPRERDEEVEEEEEEDVPGFERTRQNGPLATPTPLYSSRAKDLFANIQLVRNDHAGQDPVIPKEMREGWQARNKRSNLHKRVLELPRLFHWGVTPVDILSFALRGRQSAPQLPDGRYDFSRLGRLRQVLFLNALPWRYCESDSDVIRWLVTYHWAARRSAERRLKGDALQAFSLMVPDIVNTADCRGPAAMRRLFHMLLRVPARREAILRNMPVLHQNLTDALRTCGRNEEYHNVLSLVCSLQTVLGQAQQPEIAHEDREPEPETDGHFSPQVNPRSIVGVLATIGFEAAACLGNIPAMRIQLQLGDQAGVWKSRQGAYAAAAGLERLRNITAVATGHALPSKFPSVLMPTFDRLRILQFLTGVGGDDDNNKNDDNNNDNNDNDNDNDNHCYDTDGVSLATDLRSLATNLRSLAMYYGPVDIKGTPSHRNPIVLPGDRSPVDPVRAYFMSLARIGAFRTLYCEWRAHRSRIHSDFADTDKHAADSVVWAESGMRRAGIAKHIVDVIRSTPTIVRGVGEDEAMLADDVHPESTFEEAVRLDMKHISNVEARHVPNIDLCATLDEARLIREEEIYETERMLLSESWADGMRGLAIWLRLRSSMPTRVAPDEELRALSANQPGYEEFI